MKAIEISNIAFRYDSSSIVFSDFSLEIEQGEYVTIIGHNGSGKSTLAKLIIGLLEAKKGSIKVFGEELNEKTLSSIRRKEGIIFQNPDNQFIGTTVRDDIAFGLENHCVPHDDMEGIIQEFSSRVGMAEFLDKEPSSLSGGQKQRVAIAGVLAMKPQVIIMDESTAMLDPKGKKEIRELIKDIRKDNPSLTILSITHDIEEAYGADRVVVINSGKLVYSSTPEEVFLHKEELVNMNLDIPFVYQLKDELLKLGIEVNSNDEEGLVNEICQ